MSKDVTIVPENRSWRDIPQHVKPRAMSGQGRRRLLMGTMRALIGAVVIAGVGWGAWAVSMALWDNAAIAPDSAKSERVRNLVLVTDGVLDRNWLVRTLGIPQSASMMGLDLIQLRSKVLADPQVVSASVTRDFPGTITVRVSERSPVVRLMSKAADGSEHVLLVSRDGVSFEGIGFDPAMIATLPWLDGAAPVRGGASNAHIDGMPIVSDLMASAKLEAESLYRTWEVVSIGRLATDGEIEVHSKAGLKVIFGTNENFLRQIARLDLLIDSSSDPTHPLRQVDLSLGPQVPVAYGTAAPMLSNPLTEAVSAPDKRPLIAFPGFSNITN